MKILLVKNPTNYLHHVTKALDGHEVEILEYAPGVKFNTDGKDLVILSGGGGEGREVEDKHHNGQLFYKDEIDFILNCDKPLLGICLGFELIAHAHGAQIKKLKKGLEQFETFQMADGRVIKQRQSRDYYVPSVPAEHFEVMAQSKKRHRNDKTQNPPNSGHPIPSRTRRHPHFKPVNPSLLNKY